MGKQPVTWKEYCAEYWFKELQESMDRFTGRHDITKILLKMVLNSIQSIDLLLKCFLPDQRQKHELHNINFIICYL